MHSLTFNVERARSRTSGFRVFKTLALGVDARLVDEGPDKSQGCRRPIVVLPRYGTVVLKADVKSGL
jgi:hypothetical protein